MKNELTKREKKIIQLLCAKYSNKEIGWQWKISFHTVRKHRTNIYKKIGAHSFSDLMEYAIRHKLIILILPDLSD